MTNYEQLKIENEDISILMHKVKNDDYQGDIVLVAPIRMSTEHARTHEVKDRQVCPTKFNDRKVRWDEYITAAEALETARLIFNRAQRPELSSERNLRTASKALARDFSKRMTRLQFHGAIIERLVDILAGEKCALRLRTTQSLDHDEMFICLSAAPNSDFVERVADSEGYPAQIKEELYDALGEEDESKDYEVPLISKRECSAWTNYRYPEEGEAEKFKPFNNIDRIRMVQQRIEHFISMRELAVSGVVASHFNVHKWAELEKLHSNKERFSALTTPFLIPDPRDMDTKREYFGEHVTFYFHWFSYYNRSLIIPAILGLLVWFRRFLCNGIYRRILQDGFAIFIAMWAAYFCEMYSRKALQMSTMWGTRKPSAATQTRPDYKPENMHATSRWKRVGATLALLFLVIISSAILITQMYRYTMIHDPDSVMVTHMIHNYSHDKQTAVNAGSKIGALLITVQIKVIDAIWGKIAKWITDKENHKTQYRWTKSYVVKTVFVKFFNSMYPFLYVAFIKEHIEGCRPLPIDKETLTADDEKRQQFLGCIPGLQTYIATFFFVHLFVRFAKVLISVVKAQWRIRDDKKKPGVDAREYTYLQVQSKCDFYSEEKLVDDYMSAVVQFGLVTCFSVVLPVLTLFAFLSNLVEYRLIAFRMSYVMQRPHPMGADGTGAWTDIFKSISYLSIAVNCGLAVFAMLPFKAWSESWRFIIFVATEHALILLKLGVEAAIGGVPREIEVADDDNEEVLAKLFGGSFKPLVFERSQFGTQESIRCNVDGDKWDETYAHHDLAATTF